MAGKLKDRVENLVRQKRPLTRRIVEENEGIETIPRIDVEFHAERSGLGFLF